MADHIQSDMGDEVQNANIGKGNRQRVDDRSNVVNNYIDRNQSRHASYDERIDRLEAVSNRLVALIDGDKTWRIIGFPDQLAAYIKSNEEWKHATELRMLENEKRSSENEKRIVSLERGHQIILTPWQAIAIAFFIALAIIGTYYTVTALQGVI